MLQVMVKPLSHFETFAQSFFTLLISFTYGFWMFFAKNLFEDLRKKLRKIYEANEANAIALKYLKDAFNIRVNDILINKPIHWTFQQYQKYQSEMNKLLHGTPIQQVLKKIYIADVSLEITSDVLIPRQETEELIHLVVKNEDLKTSFRCLDIGTGSGVIAIALAKKFKKSIFYAWDIDDKALALARKNAKINQVDILFERNDILNVYTKSINLKIDIIVSNPPYVPMREKASMHKNVTNHEPHKALFVPDDNSLIFYEKIAKFACQHLVNNGRIYFEIHSSLATKTIQLLESYGFVSSLLEDTFGYPRFVICVKSAIDNPH